jgi:hypothetical protein
MISEGMSMLDESVALKEELLLSPETTVTCPSCEHEFSLREGFAKKALEALEQASADSLTAVRDRERLTVERRTREFVAQQDRSAKQEIATLKQLMGTQAADHTRAMAEVRVLAEQAFKPQLEALRSQLTESQARIAAMDQRAAELDARERGLQAAVATAAEVKAAELVANERHGYEERIAEQTAKLESLQSEQVALRQQRQKLQDEKGAMALEVQRQVDARTAEREAQVRAQEQERAGLKEAEYQKTIADMRTQLVEAQRKADQGSQQMRGEVLELAIEDGLRRAFPLDTIEEVKKGQRGGDVLQHVVTRTGQAVGTILWEMKRAKDWGLQWIPKLKEDMRQCGAVVGILVTTPSATPKDWPDSALFALHDEIWVTQTCCAMGIAEALRIGLIDLHRQRAVSAGKGEKMEALYDYLTSPQFAQKLKAVYETFKRMREELESERSLTIQRWARREKQLQAGVTQLLGIGGEIQGLAQQEMPMLELEDKGPDTLKLL